MRLIIVFLLESDPSILNTTHRMAKVFQPGNTLNHVLPLLDMFVNAYKTTAIEKGPPGRPTEDIFFNEIQRTILRDYPVEATNIIDAYRELLIYFIFNGTGSKPAIAPADSMMTWNHGKIDFLLLNTRVLQSEYVDHIMKNTKVSLRNKGTGDISGAKNAGKNEWLLPYNHQSGVVVYKGALNIRLVKPNCPQ